MTFLRINTIHNDWKRKMRTLHPRGSNISFGCTSADMFQEPKDVRREFDRNVPTIKTKMRTPVLIHQLIISNLTRHTRGETKSTHLFNRFEDYAPRVYKHR